MTDNIPPHLHLLAALDNDTQLSPQRRRFLRAELQGLYGMPREADAAPRADLAGQHRWMPR